ncbi:hypothetical protein GF371_02400 [Candidatus Woesearchaeota archaeon]|nr:hypothetical protein [Candidatus Woesearchaeota archaeon]
MTETQVSGEENNRLARWCAEKAAANIHNLRHFYPDFDGRSPDRRYDKGWLDLHRCSHEIAGGLVERIFEEVDENFLDVLPNILIYCNGKEEDEFREAFRGACRLTFARDDKEIIRLLQQNNYDGLVLGFSTARVLSPENGTGTGTSSAKSLYFGTKREPFVLNRKVPGLRKLLLAIPQFQEDDHRMLFNYVFDKPLDPKARVFQYFASASSAGRAEELEESIFGILKDKEYEHLLCLSRLVCNYSEPPSYINKPKQMFSIDGYKAHQALRRKREPSSTSV